MSYTTGWYRYRETSATVNDTAPSRISQSHPSNMIVTEGYDSIRLRFMGSASAAVTCQIWAIDRSFDYENTSKSIFMATELTNAFGLLIPVSGTQGIGAGGIVRGGEIFADTWGNPVVTPALETVKAWALDFANYALAANASTGSFNQHDAPAGEVNELLIGCLNGLRGLVLVFAAISGESINAIFKLDKITH